MMKKISPEVRDIINRVIAEKLAGMPIGEVDIRPGEDWSGDDAIFVEIPYLRAAEKPFDPKVMFAELLTDMQDKLMDAGEERFAFINHMLADGQRVMGH
jgi:hypothetical protein